MNLIIGFRMFVPKYDACSQILYSTALMIEATKALNGDRTQFHFTFTYLFIQDCRKSS